MFCSLLKAHMATLRNVMKTERAIVVCEVSVSKNNIENKTETVFKMNISPVTRTGQI